LGEETALAFLVCGCFLVKQPQQRLVPIFIALRVVLGDQTPTEIDVCVVCNPALAFSACKLHIVTVQRIELFNLEHPAGFFRSVNAEAGSQYSV
jgi:hypothetical protein